MVDRIQGCYALVACQTRLPLVEAKAERFAISDELSRTKLVHDIRTKELTDARFARDAACERRDAAAIAVIGRHCDSLASKVEEAVRRVSDLCAQLLSAAAVYVPLPGGTVGALPVSDAVRVALRRSDERPPVSQAAKDAIATWLTRLQTDAEATLSGP